MKLRATQYLPEVIQLQKKLYNLYNYNFDEEEVNKLTVKDLRHNTGNKLLLVVCYNNSQNQVMS